jgi:hypothetical protein
MELRRHYQELTPKETDELVGAVADLIVNHIKGRKATTKQKGTHDGEPDQTEN